MSQDNAGHEAAPPRHLNIVHNAPQQEEAAARRHDRDRQEANQLDLAVPGIEAPPQRPAATTPEAPPSAASAPPAPETPAPTKEAYSRRVGPKEAAARVAAAACLLRSGLGYEAVLGALRFQYSCSRSAAGHYVRRALLHMEPPPGAGAAPESPPAVEAAPTPEGTPEEKPEPAAPRRPYCGPEESAARVAFAEEQALAGVDESTATAKIMEKFDCGRGSARYFRLRGYKRFDERLSAAVEDLRLCVPVLTMRIRLVGRFGCTKVQAVTYGAIARRRLDEELATKRAAAAPGQFVSRAPSVAAPHDAAKDPDRAAVLVATAERLLRSNGMDDFATKASLYRQHDGCSVEDAKAAISIATVNIHRAEVEQAAAEAKKKRDAQAALLADQEYGRSLEEAASAVDVRSSWLAAVAEDLLRSGMSIGLVQTRLSEDHGCSPEEAMEIASAAAGNIQRTEMVRECARRAAAVEAKNKRSRERRAEKKREAQAGGLKTAVPVPGMVVTVGTPSVVPNPEEVWSDDYLDTQAYLVSRGVRPMALVGYVSSDPEVMKRAQERLSMAQFHWAGVQQIMVDRGNGTVDCGFVGAGWVGALYGWLVKSGAPEQHLHQIIGLLLGYGTQEIGEASRPGGEKWMRWPAARPNS